MALTKIPQLQVINYLLTSKDSSLIALNNLTEEYFKDYKNEFNFIKNHLETYGKIPDLETFFSTFKIDRIVVNESPEYLIKALKEISKTKYDYISSFNSLGIAYVSVNGKMGLINDKKIIIGLFWF